MSGSEIAPILMALAALATAIGGMIKNIRDNRTSREKHAELLRRFRALEDEHKQLHKDFGDLVGLLEKSDQKAGELRTKYDALKSSYDGLNHKYDQLKAQYETVSLQYDAVKAQYEEICAENEDLKKQMALVKKQTGSLGGANV